VPTPAPVPAASSSSVALKVATQPESMDISEAASPPAPAPKKEMDGAASDAGSPMPAITTRAAANDGEPAPPSAADKRAEQMELLQKEKKLLASLRAAASKLSAMDAHSQKTNTGGGLSFLGHHAPVAAAASVVDELPECLADAVLKNALLLCSNTPALREIWCKTCVQSIISTSLAPVVKTINASVGPTGAINTALPMMPAEHAETRFLFQMFQISMLGSSVRDYDQIPAIDSVVFRLFVPHMLRQLLEFIMSQQQSRSAVRMTAADAQSLVTDWKHIGYVESTEELLRMGPLLDMLGKYLVEYGMKLIKA
jgi:hypothetical protein